MNKNLLTHSVKWQLRFLETAKLVSNWSKDPSTKVGAVAVNDDRRILVSGYNGYPKGIPDDDLDDKQSKYDKIIHAEMNCIYNATHQGISLNKSILYVWGLPTCSACANGIIQSGVKYVIMNKLDHPPEHWVESWKKSEAKYTQAKIGFHWLTEDGFISYKLE